MDPADPPERFVQFVQDSGGSKTYGVCIGFNQRVGIGDPTVRSLNAGSAGFVNTTKKQYPRGVSSGGTTWPGDLVPADTVLDMVAFRCPVNYADYPTATNVAWYYVGSDCYLMVDFHASYDGFVKLPDSLVGKRIDVVEADGVTVISSYVSADGIWLTIAGTFGTLVARLY